MNPRHLEIFMASFLRGANFATTSAALAQTFDKYKSRQSKGISEYASFLELKNVIHKKDQLGNTLEELDCWLMEHGLNDYLNSIERYYKRAESLKSPILQSVQLEQSKLFIEKITESKELLERIKNKTKEFADKKTLSPREKKEQDIQTLKFSRKP